MRRLRQLQREGTAVVVPGPQSTGLALVARGLGRAEACGTLPDQGSNPCLLHQQAGSLPLSRQGSPGMTF